MLVMIHQIRFTITNHYWSDTSKLQIKLISRLQCADYTLCLGEASIENILTLKTLLRGFKMVSDLKVNFFSKVV